jgi:cytochrome c-type biogenesis protein CcmF
VAPVLPWRKAAAETIRDRMQWPLVFAVAVTVLLVASGLRGWLALLAFFLGGLGGGSAVRQLVLATRRNGWRGLVGRTNGGMIVHLGVVIIAVAFAASAAYASRIEVTLKEGESAEVGGHRVTYLGTETRRFAETNPKVGVTSARVQVDGGRVFEPAITQYRFQAQGIGTPSVRTGLVEDVYTTLVEAPSEPGAPATIGVLVHPLTIWLWIGAGLMGVGTVLAAIRAGRPPQASRRQPPPPARRTTPRPRPGGSKRDIDRVPVGARNRKATS